MGRGWLGGRPNTLSASETKSLKVTKDQKLIKDRISGEAPSTRGKNTPALAGVAQIVGMSRVHQKVVCSILGQDTHLGCGFNPWSGHIWEATN